MSRSNERDQWLKRVMPEGTTPAGSCLDAETLAAWSEGGLSGKALDAAEQHVSECSRCLALAAVMQRTMPEPVTAVSDRRALWRWMVPLTAAAAAVAIWIAVPRLQQPQTAQVQQHAQEQDKQLQTYVLPEREAVPLSPAAPVPPSAAPEPALDETQARAAVPLESRRVRRDAQDRFRSRDADLKKDADLKQEGQAAARNELKETDAPPAAPASATTAKSAAAAPAASPTGQAEVGALADRSVMRQGSLAKANVIEAAASGGRIRWRVINGTDVQRTTDGGQTWINASAPPSPAISIRDVDALRATIATSNGGTFVTTDGGATWIVQEKPAAPF